MAALTPNYKFRLPSDDELADQNVFNDNFRIIDTALHAHDEDIAEADTAEAADRAALAELIDGGGKNRLPITSVDSLKQLNTYGTWENNVYTHSSGVVFTVNDDMSITANGTASGANAVFILSMRGGFSIEAGNWILSGCPSGGSTSTYNITIAGTTSDTGTTGRFTSCSKVLVRIYVISGTTVDNLTFKPMVCSKAAWDISQAYQPYRPSYAELYAMVQELQGGSSLNSVQSTAQLMALDKTEELTTIDDSGYATENS
ncbi:hypothetical protein [Ruminococcus flavefaciens]|uniref:hypothetical protein n=1 Tax=Ruminococcus flavefaciens TaxID=1265 RepID=UPI0026EC1B50|nr:hypothetical protein [Ruminococcus flavefaciens]